MDPFEAKLDPALLASFATTFYGYGNYESRIWFVGLEEGGGDSYEAIAKHLQCWKECDALELLDLRVFLEKKGVTKWFTNKPPLQPTWRRLLRILLRSQGASIDKEHLQRAQAELLGRANGDNCLLELLPLPAPAIREWPYAELSDDPTLQRRRLYRTWAAPFRAEHLRKRIRKHHPRVVLFYGRGRFYVDWWKWIADVELRDSGNGVLTGNDGRTLFLVTPHMVAHGLRFADLDEVGRLVGNACRG